MSARPTVFDKTDGIPVIARQADCQTCFLCELYCPEDALFVSPFADVPQDVDLVALKQSAVMGSYRRAVGWTNETRERRGVDHSYLLFGH